MVHAIFPGSFDPLTNGHVDLLHRALKLFDSVTVAVLVNAEKKPLFTCEARLRLIRRCLPPDRIHVLSFDGLLVDFARKRGAKVLIRGLRAVSDYEYECQMAMMNRDLDPDIETVFLMPKSCYSFLSSRMVKEVAGLGGDVSHLVPPAVLTALKEKFDLDDRDDRPSL